MDQLIDRMILIRTQVERLDKSINQVAISLLDDLQNDDILETAQSDITTLEELLQSLRDDLEEITF